MLVGRSEKKAQSQGELRAEDAGRAGEGTCTTGCVVPLLPLLWSPPLLSLLPLALAFPPCFRYNI
jgi:hypothetical protein